MDQTEAETRLLEVFRIVLGHAVTSAANRENEAGWDSLKHVQLIFAVEEKFNVQFGEQEIPALDSFQKMMQRLMR